jgi:outer membrane protein insertion porin family/translocation and assembly module TamA
MRKLRAPLPFLALLAAVLVSGCNDDGEIKIASLKFEGVDAVDKGALADALQTREGSWLPWGRQRYFDRRAFDADLQRIEAFYRDRGFPDARVTSVDPRLNDEQNEIDITVNISEGEPIRVAAIDLEGFDVLSERARNRLQREIPLEEGEPLDVQRAATARELALNMLRNEGYPYAEVRLSNEPVEARRERVVLRATPGILAHFGPIEINGNASVGDDIILRKLSFEPGDRYGRDEMRESQRQLYSMELFQFVNVESLENQAEMAVEVPMRITVGEAKHRQLRFGVGYGSEEHARARVRWDHVNFFGGARQAGFEGRWSSLDRGVRLDFREPYFLHRDFSLGLEGQAWQAEEPVYSQNTVGGRAVLRHQTSGEQFWSLSLINEYQRSSIDAEALEDFEIRDDLIALGLDPRTGEAEGTLFALAFDVNRNTTNNLLDARRGYVLAAHLERAVPWGWGSYNYWSASVEGRHYQAVGDLFVLANRLQFGSIEPTGDEELNVPFHKRYFLGGASSNRGWGRFELSPLSGFGLPIGGHTMLDGSVEVRFPVWSRLGGVLFLDYGNVWTEAWDFDLDQLRYAVGPGLRYQTPIGPARIDLGYQLNPIDNLRVEGEPQSRQWRVHFSIGQAF